MSRPAVDDANRSSPAFGRIYKEMIIVTDPARPLPMSGKNTVVRKKALALYAEEIAKLHVNQVSLYICLLKVKIDMRPSKRVLLQETYHCPMAGRAKAYEHGYRTKLAHSSRK